MKEISVEEKAMRYDDRFKRAQKWYACNTNEGFRGIFEDIFPEFKESRDENIRNGIKILIDRSVEDGSAIAPGFNIIKEEAIAWIEKQGENNMGISEATKQKLADNLNKALEKETPESLNEFLEGEQTSTDKYKEWYDFIRWFVEQRTDDYALIPSDDDIHKWGDNILNHARMVLEPYLVDWSEESAKKMFIKALERVEEQNSNGYKLTDCDKNSWWEDFKAYTSCAIKQIHAWSEEDERMFDIIISDLERHGGKEGSCYSAEINWLKSLKERVQPKQKQELNEDTQQWIDAITKDYEEWYKVNKDHSATIQIKIDILKSLKERYAWKPSDEQIIAIQESIGIVGELTPRWECLKELEEQLKKLKG